MNFDKFTILKLNDFFRKSSIDISIDDLKFLLNKEHIFLGFTKNNRKDFLSFILIEIINNELLIHILVKLKSDDQLPNLLNTSYKWISNYQFSSIKYIFKNKKETILIGERKIKIFLNLVLNIKEAE